MTERENAGEVTERVCVVIPVFNAPEAVAACLASVLKHTDEKHRVLVLDDASTDPGLADSLDALAEDAPRVELFRHSTNLGFTATINEGCELAGSDDVVLLNSDTVVTPRWLDKLQEAAASRRNVATVTPVSNAAGAFSVPVRGTANRLPPDLSIERFAQLVESVSEQLLPEVPTGHGFCMYVRRQALDTVGPFDVDHFPRGCGEENDFCQRAIAAGYVNLVEDSTFVYHRGSASLGWRKRWLLWRSRRTLRRLHPGYEGQVANWLENDPLDRLRGRIEAALNDEQRSETRLDAIDLLDVDISQYEFLDFGASTGGSIDFAQRHFHADRGLGIDIDPNKIRELRQAGYEGCVGDITDLELPANSVRFVIISHLLEHLPDLEFVRKTLRTAARVASDFVFIQGPFFDHSDYLESLGFKYYWADWSGHPCHLTTGQLLKALQELGLSDFVLMVRDAIVDSTHTSIHPLKSPRDQHEYDSSVHPPKGNVTFDRKLYREMLCLVKLREIDSFPEIAEFLRARREAVILD